MSIRAIALITIILVSGCATTSTAPLSGAPSTDSHHVRDRQLSTTHLVSPHPEPPPPEIFFPAAAPTNVWQRIRDGFAFPELTGPYVEAQKKWYTRHPGYIERVAERARPFLYYIVEEIEKRQIPTEIALLPVVESAFKPTAYSRAHAAGLWQFIPGTAKHYGLKINWWYDGRRDVVESTRAALDYLEFLHAEFDGDWFHALAAYNAGERNIQYAIKRNKAKGKSTHYSSLRLKSETRHYVPKLMALKEIVEDPGRFGIRLAPIPNEPYFTTVDTLRQIDLTVVHELSNTETEELKNLNAGFKRWATDPDGPHRLLVPVPQAAALTTAISSLPEEKRLQWAYYKIRQGDTLGHIGRKYGVSVAALQRSNNLSSTFIRAGNDLLIPLSAASISDADYMRPAARKNPVVHRVRSGDTLWGIAQRYNVYVSQLTKWNSMRSNDLLHLGQSIVVHLN